MASERDFRAKEDRRLGAGEHVDYPFLFLVLLLLTVGLAMLYSASYAQSEYDTGYEISTKYLQKQGACALIGLAAMFFFSRVPVRMWYRFAWHLYGISIVLLLSVLGFLLGWFFLRQGQRGLHRLTVPLLFGMTAALTDETIQSFSPGRSPSPVDVGVDTAGGAAGIVLRLLGYCIYRKTQHIQEETS